MPCSSWPWPCILRSAVGAIRASSGGDKAAVAAAGPPRLQLVGLAYASLSHPTRLQRIAKLVETPEVLRIEDLRVPLRRRRRRRSVAVGSRSQPSERVGLIGPNGAGKTTLMLAIMNAVRFSGRIVVDAVEVGKKTEHEARSRCGMIFQDAEDHLFMPTLLDDVAFGPLEPGMRSRRSPTAGRRGHRPGRAGGPRTAIGAPHVRRAEAGRGAGHGLGDAGQAAVVGRAGRQPRLPIAPPARWKSSTGAAKPCSWPRTTCP